MKFSNTGNATSRPGANQRRWLPAGGDRARWQLRTVPDDSGAALPAPRAGGPTPRSATWSPTGSARWAARRSTCARGAAVARAPSRRRPGGAVAGRARCGRRASAPATSSCSSCRTGSRPASRSGRRPTSARSSCRSSTSTAPRRSDYILRVDRSPQVVVTPDRFGHIDHLAIYDALLARTARTAVAGRRRAPRSTTLPAARDGRSTVSSTPTRSPSRPRSTRTRRRSSASPRARRATRRASSTRTARSGSRPASSTTSSRRAGRRRSPARRSATSSGWSTPSSCRCSAIGR